MKKAFIFLAVAACFFLPAGKAVPQAELRETAVEIPVIIAPSLSSVPSA